LPASLAIAASNVVLLTAMARMALAFIFASLAVLISSERVALESQLQSKIQSKTESSANPIRRIVTMLQDMTKKVEAEGLKEKELYEKFMCYCKTSGSELTKSIEDAEVKIPQLEADIKAVSAEAAQLIEDLQSHKASREEAKAAMAKATEIREKEAAAFAKEMAESKSDLEALGKALKAIQKGMSGGFLQTSAAAVLRRLVLSENLGNSDRDVLSAFLSGGSNDGYQPASGEIVGIMKQMKDTMEKDLAEIIAAEETAKKEYDELMAAKQKEIDMLTKMIEEKMKRQGEVGIELVNLKEDLDDTSESLAEDKKMKADLEKNCDTKTKEFEAAQKVMQEELLALADTIKMLNDDDALELFKKTLPSASFLQVQVTAKELQKQALQALSGARSKNGRQGDTNLAFISLMLHGKKVNFDKVIKMIDDMVVLLGEEQVADDKKKAYCLDEFDKTDDKKKELSRTISDLEKVITEDKEAVTTLTEEIKALEEGILKMDREVAGATEQRKTEHEEFTATLASNEAAKKLIEMAKNRMNKFYNPKLAKFIQTQEASTDRKQESSGVIAMMDELKAELVAEIQEMEFNEKDAQEEYEAMVTDAADKRAADTKSVEEKNFQKAGLEDEIVKNGDAKAGTEAELMATKQYEMDLHADCDFLLQNYETRKEARTNEIDAIKKAKAVLSGADFSLVQTSSHRAVLPHHQ